MLRSCHLHGTYCCAVPYLHGVGKVPVDLVEHVLAAAPQQDRAGLGVLAALQESEVPSNTRVFKQC